MSTEMPEKIVPKVAVVVADGFEQVELEAPRTALQAAGFAVEIVSPVSGASVRGFHHAAQGDEFPVDIKLSKAHPEAYAALFLPGGVHSPDTLRQDENVLKFVRHFFDSGKPVAAICHGPWTLIDAGVISGRKLTSWPSIRTDLRNAGAEWIDSALVVDRGLVTSRGPQDLPAFCKKMTEVFQAGPPLGTQDPATLAKLAELIKDIQHAMLTTVEPDGTLRSRPMKTQGTRFDGTLWFFTALGSDKTQQVAAHQQVSVTYADHKSGRYVSASGRAQVIEDRKKVAALWTADAKIWFPKGIDDPDLVLLRVDVERAEYWDNPDANTTRMLGLAKSLFLGSAYQAEAGQHETLELEHPRRSESVPTPSKPVPRDKGPQTKRGGKAGRKEAAH